MPPVDNSTEFKLRDAGSYDSLTEEFDRFTQRLSRPMAERLLSFAAPRPSDQILDVGTGTGVVSLLAAHHLSGSGKVVAVDLSDPMLAVGRAKAEKQSLSGRIEFRAMDAEHMTLADASFDVCVSLFAIMHFPDPVAALREIFRVLRPAGTLALAFGSGPRVASFAGLREGLRSIRRRQLQLTGKVLIGPHALDEFITRRVPEHGGPEESNLAREPRKRARSVPQLVRQAGFMDLRTDWYGTEAVIDSPEEFWEIQRTFSSIARKRLLGLLPDRVDDLRREFLEFCCSVLSRGGNLIYPFGALYVVARRPAQ